MITSQDQLVVDLAPGLQLFIMPVPMGHTASVILGEWPAGNHACCTLANAARVDMADPDRPCLWLGDTAFFLPWSSLLQVADYLKLEIPVASARDELVSA